MPSLGDSSCLFGRGCGLSGDGVVWLFARVLVAVLDINLVVAFDDDVNNHEHGL